MLETGIADFPEDLYAEAAVRPWLHRDRRRDLRIAEGQRVVLASVKKLLTREEVLPVGPMLGVVVDINFLHVDLFKDFLVQARVIGSPRAAVKEMGQGLMMIGFVEANAGERVLAFCREVAKSFPDLTKMRLVRGEFRQVSGQHEVDGVLHCDQLVNEFARVAVGSIIADEPLAKAIANPVHYLEERRLFATARADLYSIDGVNGLYGLQNLRSETNLAQDGPIDLVGNEDVLRSLFDAFSNGFEFRLDGEMGVGKTKMLNRVAEIIEEEKLGVSLPVSFPSKAKDLLYKNAPYFAFGRMLDFIGSFLSKLEGRVDSSFFKQESVRYLINYATLAESEQIEQFVKFQPEAIMQTLILAIEALVDLLDRDGKLLCLMLDDFHNMADQDSRKLMTDFVTQLRTKLGESKIKALKIIYSGRAEQYHEGADQYLLRVSANFFELKRPMYLASAEAAISNQEDNNPSLAERFILGSFRGSLGGEALPEGLRMQKQQILRIAKLAKDLPLILVTFINRIRRDYAFTKAKCGDTNDILKIKNGILLINEEYLNGLEIDEQRGESFSGEQMQVEIMTRLLALEKLDPQLKNFLSLLAVTGDWAVNQSQIQMIDRILPDLLSDQKFKLVPYVTALVNSGYLRMETFGEKTVLSFVHEETGVALNKLISSEQQKVIMKMILANKEFWQILQAEQMLDIIMQGLEESVLDQNEVLELLPFLANNLDYQFTVARNYQSVVDFCSGLFSTSLLFGLIGQMNFRKNPETELSNIEQQMWSILIPYAQAASELGSPIYDQLKHLFVVNKDYFSATPNVRRYSDLSFKFGQALSYILDRQASFTQDDRSLMNDANTIVGLVPEDWKNSELIRRAQAVLVELRAIYRQKKYVDVIRLISDSSEIFTKLTVQFQQKNGQGFSPEHLELKRIQARCLYEQYRNKGFDNFHPKDFDADVRSLADVELSKEAIEALQGLSEVIYELYTDTILNPNKYARRGALAIADLMAGYALLIGDNEQAVEVAEGAYIKELVNGKGALVDICGRLLHHIVNAKVRSGNDFFDLLEFINKQVESLKKLGLNPKGFVAKLLDFDVLRLLMLGNDNDLYQEFHEIVIRLYSENMPEEEAFSFYASLGYKTEIDVAHLSETSLLAACRYSFGIKQFDKRGETKAKKQGLVNCLNEFLTNASDNVILQELLAVNLRGSVVLEFVLGEDGQIVMKMVKPNDGTVNANVWSAVGSPTDEEFDGPWFLVADGKNTFVNCSWI